MGILDVMLQSLPSDEAKVMSQFIKAKQSGDWSFLADMAPMYEHVRKLTPEQIGYFTKSQGDDLVLILHRLGSKMTPKQHYQLVHKFNLDMPVPRAVGALPFVGDTDTAEVLDALIASQSPIDAKGKRDMTEGKNRVKKLLGELMSEMG